MVVMMMMLEEDDTDVRFRYGIASTKNSPNHFLGVIICFVTQIRNEWGLVVLPTAKEVADDSMTVLVKVEDFDVVNRG